MCVCLAWLLLVAQPLQAQFIIPDQGGANVVNAALKLAEVAVLRNVNPAFELPDILAGRAGNFVPQSDLTLVDTSWHEADLWMRLTLQGIKLEPGQTAPAIFLLEFPKSYLDELHLYLPPLHNTESWRLQQAGDRVAQKDWFLRGLYPRFLMPSAQELLASPQGQQTVYVRIKHQFPMSVKALLHSAVQSAAITQATFLSLGLTLGAMLLTAIMALSLFVLSKDSIFGWYGVCVVFAILAMVSHSGLAHMLLWPTDGYWPGTATLVFLLLATACQLQFCRVLFLPDSPAKWLPRISMILGAMCASTAMAFALLPDYWTQMYVLSLVMVFLAFGLSWRLVYLAWRGGNSLALAWLAAFMPLFATVLIGLLDGVGLLENNLAYQLPMYAAAFEVILVGLALQWFAHDRHGEHERHQALQNIDPLTGFVNARAFAQITKLAWDKHAQTKQDFSIAYVQVMGTAASPTPSDRMLRRCVRVLRTVTREGDTVARLDERTLAMLLPAMGMGDDLSARLSRIVALGLMPDSTDRHNVTLGFRIAAMSRLHYHDALDELDEQLRSLLSKQDRWGGKSIRYLDTRPAQNKYKFSDSQAMSDVWEFAVNAEKHTAPAPPAAKSQARSITIAPSPQQSPPRNR